MNSELEAYIVPGPTDRDLRREIESLRKVLLYWRDECSGNEPSLSVFNRMVDEALAPSGMMAWPLARK